MQHSKHMKASKMPRKQSCDNRSGPISGARGGVHVPWRLLHRGCGWPSGMRSWPGPAWGLDPPSDYARWGTLGERLTHFGGGLGLSLSDGDGGLGVHGKIRGGEWARGMKKWGLIIN